MVTLAGVRTSFAGVNHLSIRRARVARVSANLVGAVGAAFFAEASLRFFLQTHRLIGAALLGEQTWIVLAYLLRRPARAVSRRAGDWVLAFAGTFGGVLFRPVGGHPHWGVVAGLAAQLAGLSLCVIALLTLGRSFGFAAADRGLVTRGPYALVRHPVYTSYLVLGVGYLLQSISVWNALVLVLVTAGNMGRAIVEERLLAASSDYAAYCTRVRWRLVPGLW